jgi:hypothetical protein
VGEEPFSAGAPADGAAVVGGVQEAVEGGLGGCRGVCAGPVDPQQDYSLLWSSFGPSSVEREGIPTGKCAERFGTLANYI